LGDRESDDHGARARHGSIVFEGPNPRVACYDLASMAADPNVVLETIALTKTYGRRHAVDGLELQVRRGEVYGFLGPNGAGKTTTLRLVLGLISPTKGEVRLFGRSLAQDRLGLLARTGALVEMPAFYPFLSGRKNLLLLGRATGRTTPARVDECLDAVGLLDRGGDLFKGYSRGMKQRLGIAWAMLGKPELILLDEPLNGLDPPAVLMIRALIRKLAQDGATVFLSSHLLHEVELGCDRVAIIDQGRLIAQGSVEELIHPDRDVLEIECDDPHRALVTARTLAFVSDARVEPSAREQRAKAPHPLVLTVELATGHAHELNAALVGADHRVSALVPRRKTLEELFHARVAETRRKTADMGSAPA
jgi:ABC-2 type transport system ATP-binding protein